MDSHRTKNPGRPRRLFAALWTLAGGFILLWGLVILTSALAPPPGRVTNHISRRLVEGQHVERSGELVAADAAAMGRILLATNQRGCQTGGLHWIHAAELPRFYCYTVLTVASGLNCMLWYPVFLSQLTCTIRVWKT
jgi:hypothetical protein